MVKDESMSKLHFSSAQGKDDSGIVGMNLYRASITLFSSGKWMKFQKVLDILVSLAWTESTGNNSKLKKKKKADDPYD